LPEVGDFKFAREAGRTNPRVEFRLHWDSNLNEMVGEFTNFLRACRFHVDQDTTLEVTKAEKNTVTTFQCADLEPVTDEELGS
jgi:hypothetical protein